MVVLPKVVMQEQCDLLTSSCTLLLHLWLGTAKNINFAWNHKIALYTIVLLHQIHIPKSSSQGAPP